MSLKIALVTQYFWPESFIINDLVQSLSQQGHTVEIFTGKPNYPDGAVFAGYKKSGYQEDVFNENIKVHRAPLHPRGTGSKYGLIRNYLSFVVNGLRYFRAPIKKGDFDLVFVFTLSPITSAIPAIYLKWLIKKPLVLWVQDLWPESLRATGFIKNRFLLWAVGVMVRAIYACADAILVQSHAFVAPVARYADRKKIIFYANSYNDAVLAEQGDGPPQELLQVLEQNFCIVFAGNLGLAQSVETLVGLAQKMQALDNSKLVLVGSGSQYAWIQQQIAAKGLNNIILAGRYPPACMPQFFKRAAGLLVTLRKDEIFSYTVPSKVQAYLAAGRPLIAALDGEGARIIQEAKAGFTCAAEDTDGLYQCVRRLYDMPLESRNALGQAGRDYFAENFELNKQTLRLVEIMKTVIAKSQKDGT